MADDNILDRIDEILLAAREYACACGCGRKLNEKSSSLYYANQECQAKAMRASARNPSAIEDRPDVSVYSDGGYARGSGGPPWEDLGWSAALASVSRRGPHDWRSLTEIERDAVRNWLRANNVEPSRVPIDTDIVTTADTLTVTVMEQTPAGDPQWVRSEDSELGWEFITSELTVPLLAPWPEGVRYSYRLRSVRVPGNGTGGDQEFVIACSNMSAPTWTQITETLENLRESFPEAQPERGGQMHVGDTTVTWRPSQGWAGGTPHPSRMRSRRQCPNCRVPTDILHGHAMDEHVSGSVEPVRRVDPGGQCCAVCGYRYDVAVQTLWRHVDSPPGWELRASVAAADGQERADRTSFLSDNVLLRTLDMDHVVAHTWGQIIDDVLTATGQPGDPPYEQGGTPPAGQAGNPAENFYCRLYTGAELADRRWSL